MNHIKTFVNRCRPGLTSIIAMSSIAVTAMADMMQSGLACQDPLQRNIVVSKYPPFLV